MLPRIIFFFKSIINSISTSVLANLNFFNHLLYFCLLYLILGSLKKKVMSALVSSRIFLYPSELCLII